jgi:F-type H+-transporting ATPase subunit epsilon
MAEFPLEIVTPDGLAFDGMVESLLVKTDDGDVEFLAGHIDYMASLGTGKARIKAGGTDRFASVSGGFVTAASNEVKLVAITFEFADAIDLERAMAARDKATELLSTAKDAASIELAKAKLQRALNRISVAQM